MTACLYHSQFPQLLLGPVVVNSKFSYLTLSHEDPRSLPNSSRPFFANPVLTISDCAQGHQERGQAVLTSWLCCLLVCSAL
jgi:hypothetical protein